LGRYVGRFLKQRRAIKEISRELQVSRATVRSDKTAFKYALEVRPAPKLGEWIGPLTEILKARRGTHDNRGDREGDEPDNVHAPTPSELSHDGLAEAADFALAGERHRLTLQISPASKRTVVPAATSGRMPAPATAGA
jgi:hypothetical protein